MNKETFLLYADDQLKNSAKPEEVEKLFRLYSTKLGKFKEYKDLSIQQVFIRVESGGRIFGQYIVGADFERGLAEIKVTVIKEDADWKILEFTIKSMALLDR